MAPHSSTLAWKILWTEKPGRLQSMGSLIGHDWAASLSWLSSFTFTFLSHSLKKEMAAHSSILAWRIPGRGEPGGLPPMGLHRVRHDWSDLAAAAAIDKLRRGDISKRVKTIFWFSLSLQKHCNIASLLPIQNLSSDFSPEHMKLVMMFIY